MSVGNGAVQPLVLTWGKNGVTLEESDDIPDEAVVVANLRVSLNVTGGGTLEDYAPLQALTTP